MNNEGTKVVETPEDDLDIEIQDLQEGDDSTDWKAEAQKAKEEAKRYHGMAKRYKNDVKKPKEEPKQTEKHGEPEKKEFFDYGQKAFMRSNDIKSDEFGFVQNVMEDTGKSLDDVLESKYFQAELKERREEKATKEATPPSSKRSSSSPRDTVEYWIQKGELPPDRDLRQKVVNEKINREKSKSIFSDQPVV